MCSRGEHPLPLLLPYMLAMVVSCHRLSGPFLLIIGPVGCVLWFQPEKIIEIIFVPRRADFLCNCQAAGEQRAETADIPPSSGHEISSASWLKD
jgi:hypothetical protein